MQTQKAGMFEEPGKGIRPGTIARVYTGREGQKLEDPQTWEAGWRVHQVFENNKEAEVCNPRSGACSRKRLHVIKPQGIFSSTFGTGGKRKTYRKRKASKKKSKKSRRKMTKRRKH